MAFLVIIFNLEIRIGFGSVHFVNSLRSFWKQLRFGILSQGAQDDQETTTFREMYSQSAF